MQLVTKLTMFTTIVSDMPKAKAFYADQLGLEVKTDFRQDDDHWWVSLSLPEGGMTVTLTTYHENVKQGNISLYFTASDLEATQKALADKGIQAGEIQNDLYGPGSGVKFLKFEDPDGNWVHIAQA